jgi:Raf kinase inhibitor-like YbhB/YbcL family protein
MRRSWVVVVVLAVTAFVTSLVLLGCTAPSGPQPGSSIMSAEASMSDRFVLTSPEFTEGGAIPRRFTCDADDVSPPLAWEGAPPDTVTLALIVDDPDAGGFVHWVAYNIDASATGSLPAGWSSSPDAAPQGTNSFGRVGYGGPCPPSGTHRYAFKLLAIDQVLDIEAGPKAPAVLDAASGHILAETTLTGTYRRGG